jgi:uncharacterized YigZ family protein
VNFSFKTISKPSEGVQKVKGSKFLSFALPVQSTDEIKEQLIQFRKEYHDARHICYAWMLGPERTEYRANDDGEPSGTAGRPILGQINSYGVTNVLIVVVRYFGGVLLGTGGLTAAYRDAADQALTNAEIIESEVVIRYNIGFDYIKMNEVMKCLKECESSIHSQEYEYECVMKVDVPLRHQQQFLQRMQDIESVYIIS